MKKIFVGLVLAAASTMTAKAQFYSLRTNLIGLATTNLNLEASFTLDRKHSLHIPVQYSPFEFAGNRQFKNFTIGPGMRYWFRESYSNWFIGGHALFSKYSIGKIWNKKRYEGEAYGAGFSAGYACPIAKRWNLEWEMGIAGIWTHYDKYNCMQCGDWERGRYAWRIIPSRIAFNVVYLF